LDTESESSFHESDTEDSSSDPQELMLEDPMYYILGEFLQNNEKENIASILTRLVDEVKQLRITLSDVLKKQTSS